MSGLARGVAAPAAPRGRARGVVVGGLRLITWGVAGLALGLALALAAPLAFEARPVTVLTGSMAPTLEPGDVAIARRIAPLDARPGDVVTFRDPGRGDRLVTHRVRSVHARGDRVVFVTRGDANNASERWSVRADGELSRTLYRIPEVGHAIALARTRTGLFLLIVFPLFLLGVWEIAAIWREDDA